MGGAGLAGSVQRRVEQRPPEPLAAAARDDVELLDVGVGPAVVDRAVEAQQAEAVGALAGEEDGDLTRREQAAGVLGEGLDPRRVLLVFGVEVVQEAGDVARVAVRGPADQSISRSRRK